MEPQKNSLMLIFASILTLIVVFFRTCKELGIHDWTNPYFYLAVLSTLPYILFFAVSFFIKGEKRRKFAYCFLSIMVLMNCFDWFYHSKDETIGALQSAVWFLQLMLILPYAMVIFGKIERIPPPQ